MSLVEQFESDPPHLLNDFLTHGYVIRDVEDRSALEEMRHEIVKAAVKLLDKPLPEDEGSFLDNIHRHLSIDKVNAFRLGMYRGINDQPWFRPTYFHLGRRALESLVGNELAMQNRINFSIQMPDDKTSLLDLHADVFTGETPFQVVQWLPLVDVMRTKSMFILPRARSEAMTARMTEFAEGGMPKLFERIKDEVIWLDIPFGKVLIFSPNFLHGNVLNEEPTTRWSLNTRFKSLFTPYGTAEKGLGAYFLPITVRPTTRLGMAYRRPDGFKE